MCSKMGGGGGGGGHILILMSYHSFSQEEIIRHLLKRVEKLEEESIGTVDVREILHRVESLETNITSPYEQVWLD
jgi:hypothetical protein